MRWSIVGLMLLGVVAAGCAAVLVASLRANARIPTDVAEDPAREVEVIVAAKAIEPMTIVQAEAVTSSKMPRNEAPAECYHHPSAVVGRVLAIPVVAGQPLTQDCFQTEGPIAPFLPDGMRAVTLPLSPSDAGMIYPGSSVDVLVSLTRPASTGGKTDEAISFALLQGVEVLAIDGHTILGDPDEAAQTNTRGSARHKLVTLMVDPAQAKALQLAVKYGKVSLALRNPLDADRLQKDPTPLMDLLESERGKDAQAGSDVKNRRMQVTILRGGVEEVKWVSRSVGEQRTARKAKLASYPTDGLAQGDAIRLDVGRQMVIQAPWPTKRVSVTDPKIADVQVATPEQLILMGKSLGTTDLIMWSEDEETWQARVDVGDIPRLKTELMGLFPGCTLDVKRSENVVIVAGLLSSAEQVNELRDFLDATGLKYIDRTRLAGVQQVEIEVRVAEASRRALRELGINTTIRATTEHGLGRLWPPVGNDFATGTVGPRTGLASLIAGFPHADLEVFLEALAENHYVQVLAEPNLTAVSGEEASFLAGGEFPIPVVQGGAGGTSTAISIEYKEYGVALRFLPVVLGNNTIRLHVGTEVSRLSLKGAVVIEGFRVPAVETRRAETTLELRSGQMFGMAGLIEQDTEALNSRVPWLGDLPVLGPLFRSVRYERGETELVVLVRATLVEPLSVDSSPPLPGALHVPPTDAQLYGEGRLEGTPPTDVPLPDAAWRKKLGLEWLRSPGTWARHDSPSIPSRSTLQLPVTTPPSPRDHEARTVAAAPAASASSN